MQRKTVYFLSFIIVLLAGAAVFLLVTRKPSFRSSVIQPAAPAADIQLTNVNGQPFALADQRGKVVLVFFGYTNCPDECPLTLAHLKQALANLGPGASDVEVVLVTTDPVRDTPDILRAYLDKFNPAFIGLTGSAEALAKVYTNYGVMVEAGGETHSTFVYVIDRKGDLRLTFNPDSDPADVASDLSLLLKE